MHFKSILGISLTVLFSTVKAGETCDYLDKYDNIVSTCYRNDDNIPNKLWIRNDINNTVLNDVAKLTSLTELEIENNLNVENLDLSILKKLKNLKKLTYIGELNSTILKSISKIKSITELDVDSNVNGNVDVKPLKGLKLETLSINCNNIDTDVANYIVPKTISTFAKTLKNLNIGDCLIDDKEDLSSLTKVNNVNAFGWIDNKIFKKIAAMKSVKNVYFYFQKLGVGIKDKYVIDVSDLQSAPKLTELSISSALSRYRGRVRVKVGSLKGFKKLKSLYFHAVGLTEGNINEISKIKTLESLSFNGDPLYFDHDVDEDEEIESYTVIYDALVNLKSSLKYLEFTFPKKTVYDSDIFSEFPEFIFSLTNLKNLTINDSNIKSIPEKIVELKKLENLDLSNNDLVILPSIINDLKKLKYLDVSRNPGLTGKILNNNKLEYCNYKKTNMCKDENVKCLRNADYEINSCSSQCNQYYEYLIQEKGITSFSSNYCKDNEEGKISRVGIDDSEIDENCIDMLLTFKDTITEMNIYWYGNESVLKKIAGFTNLQELNFYLLIELETLDLSPLNNLVNLRELTIDIYNESNSKIKEGSLDKLSNLYSLRLEKITLTQGLVDDIGKLTKLGVLDINYSGFPTNIDYDPWKNLKNVFYLYIRNVGVAETPLIEIPKAVYSMTGLTKLTINYQKITTIDSDIANLKNLDDLELGHNDLTSLPIELNKMESLTAVNFQDNPNLKGKVVDNDNVTSCYYDRNSNLCKPRENIKCFDRLVIPNNLPLCN